MRILTYCDEDLAVAAGGSRQVLEFAKAMTMRGHELDVVAPQGERPEPGVSALPRMHMHTVPVVRWGGLRPVSFLLNSERTLSGLLREAHPEVFLWFDSPGQMAPLWALQRTSCPVVYFINGLPAEEVRGVWRRAPLVRLLTHGLRLAARKARFIVSVCPELFVGLQKVEPIDSRKCIVIKNGVDSDHFWPCPHEEARRELHLAEQGPYVGFVGGFFPWHGLDTLVTAMAIVVRTFPTVQCLLIGEGHTKAALEEQVQHLNLSHHIHFTGRADFEEVPRWIAACDVCVVLHRRTRSYPGDSMKLWEYLACGRPVVATAGPGYGDTVVEFGSGLSAQPDDPDDLARQLLRLLSDEALRRAMGARGRTAVVRSHTWSARAAQLEQLCLSAISETEAVS